MQTLPHSHDELEARLRALTTSPSVMTWKSAHHGFIAICFIAIHVAIKSFGYELLAWLPIAIAIVEGLRAVKWSWRALSLTVSNISRGRSK